MNKKIIKLSVAILTFSFGLSVFYLCQLYPSTKTEQNSILITQNIDTGKLDSSVDFDPWKLPDDFPPLRKGEFFQVGRACGNGYVAGWLAYDESRLSEGFNDISRKDFDKEISEGVTIIEKIENYPNKDGKKGLRVVLHGINKETGKDFYSILWFGKWYKKDYGRYFINGPNLEIALEFEKKLIKDSQKAK